VRAARSDVKRAVSPSWRTTANVFIARNAVVLATDPTKLHAFCGTCGTPVYLTFAAMPELIAVHAGSLDDPSQFEPKLVTYSIRGHEWDAIDPLLPKFERMP